MAGFKIQCSYFNGQNVSTAVFNILCRLEEKKKMEHCLPICLSFYIFTLCCYKRKTFWCQYKTKTFGGLNLISS